MTATSTVTALARMTLWERTVGHGASITASDVSCSVSHTLDVVSLAKPPSHSKQYPAIIHVLIVVITVSQKRDFPQNMESVLGLSTTETGVQRKAAVLRVVMQQILSALQSCHDTGACCQPSVVTHHRL